MGAAAPTTCSSTSSTSPRVHADYTVHGSEIRLVGDGAVLSLDEFAALSDRAHGYHDAMIGLHRYYRGLYSEPKVVSAGPAAPGEDSLRGIRTPLPGPEASASRVDVAGAGGDGQPCLDNIVPPREEPTAESRVGSGMKKHGREPRRERVALAIASLVLLLTFASCGDGGETSSTQSSGAQGGEPGSSDVERGGVSVPGASDCPVQPGTVEAALGVDSVHRKTEADGTILAPVPTHASGAFDGPPVVYRHICTFESGEVLAVAIFSSPPVPPVTRNDVDHPSMVGVEEELMNPATGMEEIRRSWENTAEEAALAEVSIADRPQWGEGAFLVRIDESEGPVDVWFYATAPGMAIRVVAVAAGPERGEAAAAVSEDAVAALAAEVYDAS